jgi:hypothetical protein
MKHRRQPHFYYRGTNWTEAIESLYNFLFAKAAIAKANGEVI